MQQEMQQLILRSGGRDVHGQL